MNFNYSTVEVRANRGVFLILRPWKTAIFSTPINNAKNYVVEKVNDFARPINKLEGKPNVEVKKLQIELNSSDETVKEYLKHMKNELIDQPDKGLSAIYINEPNDWFKFREPKKVTKYSKISNSKQTDATEFYTRPITSVDDAIVRTSDVVQKTFDPVKTPFRINFENSILYHSPVLFKDTKHMIITLTHIAIAIYKFNPTTGGAIVLPDYMTKNQNVVGYPYDNN